MKSKMTAGEEALLIASEEASEVAIAISKITRFGMDSRHPDRLHQTNKEHLEEELGDFVCMLGLLVDMELVSLERIEIAAEAKKAKLKKWSGLFNNES